MSSPNATNFSTFPAEFQCFRSTVGRYVLTTMFFTNTLFILPLSIFVLYLGFQRWRRRSSDSVVTHSDFFTYNMAVMELIAAFGGAFFYCSSYAELPALETLGFSIKSFNWAGQTLFPLFTCVERYLAVVHPVTYRDLRHAGGTRIRNITAGCIWLVCCVWMCFVLQISKYTYYKNLPGAFMLTICLVFMGFLSLSVVRVLIRPRPGSEVRGGADQSKLRAVRTIQIIMGVLWLKLGGSTVTIIMRLSTLESLRCVGEGLVQIFSLVGSLVLPLLFLQRAGKLPQCEHNAG